MIMTTGCHPVAIVAGGNTLLMSSAKVEGPVEAESRTLTSPLLGGRRKKNKWK